MPFTTMYTKKDCSSFKDINWKGISSNCKLDVPAMVVSSVQKKLAKAKSFEVNVDQDSNAGKARVVLKGVAPKDIIIDWTFGSSKELAQGISKVKAALMAFGGENKRHLARIEEFKKQVKTAKDAIKVIEGKIPGATFNSRAKSQLNAAMEKTGTELQRVQTEGFKAFRAHQDWYLAGPRKGVAPLIAQAKLEESKLDAATAKDFNGALAKMSTDANTVKKIHDTDIKAASTALLARLENLSAKLNLGHANALEEIEKSAAEGLSTVKGYVTKAVMEAKVPKSEQLAKELQSKGRAYDRLTGNPKFIESEKQSNATRLGNFPKYLELVRKQVSRVKKGIPADFAKDGKLPGIIRELDAQIAENDRNLKEARTAIEAADAELDKLAKQLGV